MATQEDRHWWYRGLRHLLADLLRERFRLPNRPQILDAGCGTGANLRWLDELLDPAYLGGFDLSPLAIEWARRKAPAADLYLGDLRAPELHIDELDLILSADVAYIPGAVACETGLRRLAAALRPGGLFVIHLPAFDWLRGEHDLAVGTTERFTRRDVRTLLERIGLEALLVSYRVFWLFPLIVARRVPGHFLYRWSSRSPRSDLRRTQSPIVEALCLRTLVAENRRLAAGGGFPWGSSVIAVGRRRK